MVKIIIFLTLTIMLFSCAEEGNTVTDVRMIQLGMNSREVKYFLGEPVQILFDEGNEEWYFKYDQDITLQITMEKGKVIEIYSY